MLKSDQSALAHFLESRRSTLNETAHTLTNLFAEDCVQEAILKSIAKIELFKGSTEEQLVAWARRIVINECLSKIRLKKNSKHVGLSKVGDLLGNLSTPSKNLRLDEELQKLNQALDQLNERERDAATYHYLLGLSVLDTAELMGETKGAVQGLLFRGVKKLGTLLRESQFSVLLQK